MKTPVKKTARSQPDVNASGDGNTVKKYRVLTEGWPDGKYRKVGDAISMTVKEAEYLVMNGQVVLEADYAAAKKAKAETEKVEAEKD